MIAIGVTTTSAPSAIKVLVESAPQNANQSAEETIR
jgi:hypothetical protein